MSRPLVGRVTAVIPFFSFTVEEQAVVAHKLLLEETRRARCRINPDKRQSYGDIQLHIKDNGPFSQSIALQAYHPELGARSLASFIGHNIMSPLTEVCLGDDGEDPSFHLFHRSQ